MMTKMQKVWLWIFIAMFAVPEILWSPVVNFVYSFSRPPINGYPQLLRDNFLLNFKSENFLKGIIFIQLVGIVLFSTFWLKNKSNIKSKATFWTILFLSFLVCLINLFVFYIAIIFSPSFP